MKPITKSIRIIVGWRHKCPECKGNFENPRRDAITCSPRCRQRRKRAGRSDTVPPAGPVVRTVTRVVEVLVPPS